MIIRHVMQHKECKVSPVGSIMYYYGEPLPSGFVECDGASYKSGRDFPRIEQRCRKFTKWWNWHLRRRFNVPDLREAVTTTHPWGVQL